MTAATRLTASTSNPFWYAEQLAAFPVPYRVVGGAELRNAVRAVGRRMLAATEATEAMRATEATEATEATGAPKGQGV